MACCIERGVGKNRPSVLSPTMSAAQGCLGGGGVGVGEGGVRKTGASKYGTDNLDVLIKKNLPGLVKNEMTCKKLVILEP
jgi:hypothetical protein